MVQLRQSARSKVLTAISCALALACAAVPAGATTPRLVQPSGGGPSGPVPGGAGGPGGAGHGTVKHVVVVKHEVRVSVSCAGLSLVRCAVKLTLSRAGTPAAQRRSNKPTSAAPVIGSSAATLPGGTKRQVAVPLNAAGERLLLASHPLHAKLTVAQGKRVIFTGSVVFSGAPAPGKRS